MAQTFEKIPDELISWIEAQPVFFVATAPAVPPTHINVSPRGLDTFRVLDANRVAWLDLTGSGVETIAHLRADGRITLMFCTFDDPPRIVRLYGRGAVHEPKDEAHDALRSHVPDLPGARAIIDVAVERVSSSCGFGVPLMELVVPREQHVEFARRKGEARMAAYLGPDNVFTQLPGTWRTAFGVSAALLLPLQGAGCLVGLRAARASSQPVSDGGARPVGSPVGPRRTTGRNLR